MQNQKKSVKKRSLEAMVESEEETMEKRINSKYLNGEFDPGSGRTLAACLTHASRTDLCPTQSVVVELRVERGELRVIGAFAEQKLQ